MEQPPTKLAVLISGSGTTLLNLIQTIQRGELKSMITLVVASKPAVKGIEIAGLAELSTVVIDRRQFTDVETFSQQVFDAIDPSNADLVCLAGWLHLLHIPGRYQGRVLNIHPSLLPKFGGKGMYGLRVHQAVIDAGCKVSGCTVHRVDNVFDNGPIVIQRTCPVQPDDTAVTLAARVFEEEKLAYPEAIRQWASNPAF